MTASNRSDGESREEAASIAPMAVKRRGYAGRTAEQLAAERRQRLLDAALELFAERGFSKTPIEVLCSTARVTTRHFYEHFASREAVLVALYEQITTATRAIVMTALQAGGETVEDRMFSAIRAFVDGSTADPRRTRILCVEVIGVSNDMFERRRSVAGEFADLLHRFTQQFVAAGTLPAGDYRPTCMAMVGAIRELMTDWLIQAERPAIEVLHGQIKRLFQCLLAGAVSLERDRPGRC